MPNSTDQAVFDFISENYGDDVAGFLDIPELRTLLIEAGTNEWSPALFATKLRSTNWWKVNSESVRTWVTARIVDPAQFEATIKAKEAELRAIIAPLGLNLGGPAGVRKWAENAIKYGWTPEQLNEKLTGQLTKKSNRGGFGAETVPDVTADRLMQIARSEYLTPIDRQTAERWAIKGIAQGAQGADIESQFRSYMTTLSASRFGIDPNSGINPADIMAPVRQTIAKELELNAEAIDLLDPKWSAVLQTETKEGGFRPMTMSEATAWARSQEDYKHTTGAVDQASRVVEQLSRTFGKVS